MLREPSPYNYWAHSFHKLAENCRRVAEDTSPEILPALRAEARRVYASWVEDLALPEETFEQTSRRTIILQGLRKRTIEILVKAYPEPE